MNTGDVLEPIRITERQNSQKLFIAVPIYGMVEPNFFLSWSRLLANWNLNVAIYPHLGDSLVSRARNHCTRMFLESDCTHMLFIDSDLTFSVDQINRLMTHDEEVVGGMYWKKSEGDPQGVWNLIPDREIMPNGLLRAGYIGTGFLRIARSVFEKMIASFGDEMAYRLDPDQKQLEYDFWHVGPYKYADGRPTRYLSEDWWFCQKWMDLGGKCWLDLGVQLAHSGSATYPLKTQQDKIFKRVPAAKAAESLEQGGSTVAIPSALPPELYRNASMAA
jgi:hypothetical protein